jgi:hypothetical protein
MVRNDAIDFLGGVLPACLVLAFTLGGSGCRRQAGGSDSHGSMVMPSKTIEQVQQEHTDEWMAIPGVVGVAIGQDQGRPCIVILAASETGQARKRIPSRVDGYAVVIQSSGPIRALDK